MAATQALPPHRVFEPLRASLSSLTAADYLYTVQLDTQRAQWDGKDTAMTGKVIYLARRNPALTREEFAQRWKKHAAVVGAGAPDALTEIRAARYCLASGAQEYDGVGLLSLASLNSIPSMHGALVGTEVSLADELRTFSTYVKDFAVYCSEEVVRDTPPTSHVLLHFVRRSETIQPTTFAAAWRDHARHLEQSLEGVLRRQVLNHVIAPAPPGCGFDGVHELWCDSSTAAADINTELVRLRPKVAEWLSPRTGVVLTTETIFSWPQAGE
jgi:hypothetical protein